MARSLEPATAGPERRLSERVAVEPEVVRPLPASTWSGRGATLSHGAAVEASILARLLGIPLLRLDAHVDMVPIDGDQVVRSPMVLWSAMPPARGVPADPTGALADAAELLQRASRTLAAVRRERVAAR